MRQAPGPYTFFAATLSLVALFAVSSAPVPLFGLLQAKLSMSSSDLAMTAVSYFGGCIPALLFLSRLPNCLGRKVMVSVALAIGLVSALLLANADAVIDVLLARFMQGMACGLASGSAMAWVFDAAPSHRRSLAAALSAGSPGMGFLFGALAGAVLNELFGLSLQTIFYAVASLLALALLAVLFGKETVNRNVGATFKALIPAVEVPERLRATYVLAVLAYAGTWGVGGFFQAYSAKIATDALHSTSTLTAAFIFLSFIGTNAFGGFFASRLTALSALRIYMGLFLLAVICMFAGLWVGSVTVFFVFSVIGGVCVGAVCASALRLLTHDAQPGERSGLLAAVYLAAYIGPGIPNLAFGLWVTGVTVSQMSLFYGFWALVFTLAVWGVSRRFN